MNRQRQGRTVEQRPTRRGRESNIGLSHGEVFLPDRSQIEEACEQIRTEWSNRQHRIRAGLSPDEGIVLEPVSLGAVRWNFGGLNED